MEVDLQKRRLGRSDIVVAPWCFGGNVFGWTADEATSFALLDAFVDAGFDFIDTADVYSRWAPGHTGGESETIIGRWLKSRRNRDRVVIATKVGMDMGPGKDNLSRTYVAEAVEASLRRLGTDRIDLYQAHRDDPKTPIEETLEAFGDLVAAGKVRAIGASNFAADRLKASLEASARLGLPRYETLQPEYNLYARQEFEADLLPLCREAGVSVIPYFSLAAGFLTGKYRSEADLGGSARGEGIRKYLNPRGFRVLDALDAVARRRGATPAEIALAWLAGRDTIAAPIASATSLDQFHHLARAAELALDPADREELDRASAPAA